MLGGNSRTLRDGIAAALARDFEAAAALLQRATTECPTDVSAWLWRAAASPAPADAIPCLRRVLVFEPSHAAAQQALARLLANQAAQLAGSGDHAQALALAREAAGLAPDCDAVWAGLAAVCDEPHERVDALRRAHELNPQSSSTQAQLRDTLLQCGVAVAGTHPERAREFFHDATLVDPSDPRGWQALARVARGPGEAIHPLRELMRLTPDRPGVRATLKRALAADGEALAAAGSPAEAVLRWREAIAIDGADATLWLGLAAVTDDREEALRALDAVHSAGLADPRVELLTARWRTADSEPRTSPEPCTESTLVTPSVPPPLVATPAPVAPVASVAPPAPAAIVAPTPVPLVAPRPTPPTAPPAATPAPAATNGKRTIMVVDDSPTVRKILSLTLERAGYGVLSAGDGEAALGALEGSVPDLILLDISMPKLDGYEVCRRIKADARTAHVPVVMLSGKDAFFDKVKGRMAGATEYLTKPFATPAVLAVIGRQFAAAAEPAHG